jgi:hypothetical protein
VVGRPRVDPCEPVYTGHEPATRERSAKFGEDSDAFYIMAWMQRYQKLYTTVDGIFRHGEAVQPFQEASILYEPEFGPRKRVAPISTREGISYLCHAGPEHRYLFQRGEGRHVYKQTWLWSGWRRACDHDAYSEGGRRRRKTCVEYLTRIHWRILRVLPYQRLGCFRVTYGGEESQARI